MSRTRGHIPIRTCIGCGVKRDKKEMIRLVLGPGGVIKKDNFGKGRGAYICGDKNCMSVLKTGRGLQRAFRKRVSIQVSAKDLQE